MTTTFVALLVISTGAAASAVAVSKHRNAVGWFAIGFCFGLIGVILAIVLPARTAKVALARARFTRPSNPYYPPGYHARRYYEQQYPAPDQFERNRVLGELARLAEDRDLDDDADLVAKERDLLARL